MKMIVGLGNIGSRYDETRHNSGFMVVEQIARDYQLGAFSHTKYEAVAATGMIDGEKVMLVKPTTFMNDSGRAVKPLMDYYQVDLADLVIVGHAGWPRSFEDTWRFWRPQRLKEHHSIPGNQEFQSGQAGNRSSPKRHGGQSCAGPLYATGAPCF